MECVRVWQKSLSDTVIYVHFWKPYLDECFSALSTDVILTSISKIFVSFAQLWPPWPAAQVQVSLCQQGISDPAALPPKVCAFAIMMWSEVHVFLSLKKKCIRKGFWEKKPHTMFYDFYVWVLIVRTSFPHFTLTLWSKFSEIIILSFTILWTTIPVLRSIIFLHSKFNFSIDFSKIQQHPFQQLQYQAPKQ